MGTTASSKSFYRRDNGSDSQNRSDAVTVGPDDIVSSLGSTFLAPGLFIGIAKRETNFAVNEHDIDYDEGGNVVRHTYGIFQLDDPSDLGDLSAACSDAIATFERYANDVMSAAGLSSMTRDAYAYVCWAHNAGEGNGQAIDSIRAYGLDWEALKSRQQNDYVRNRLIPYAEAVMSYVDQYPSSSDSGSSDSGSGDLGILLLIAGAALLLWQLVAT